MREVQEEAEKWLGAEDMPTWATRPAYSNRHVCTQATVGSEAPPTADEGNLAEVASWAIEQLRSVPQETRRQLQQTGQQQSSSSSSKD